PVHRAFQADKGGSFDAYLLRMDLDDKRVFYSSFWGGSGRDEAGALALGPGDAAVFAGVSYSSDLPVENAEQPVIGSANDAFVAQVCDPWPGYWSPIGWNGEVHYVRGGEKPEPFEVVVYTFCQQPFEAVGPESSSEWLAVSSDGG